MRLRFPKFQSLRTYNISVETSIGRVTGELWSDRLIALGTQGCDAEASDFSDINDLVGVLEAVGLPAVEAPSVALSIWDGGLGKFVSRHLRQPDH